MNSIYHNLCCTENLHIQQSKKYRHTGIENSEHGNFLNYWSKKWKNRQKSRMVGIVSSHTNIKTQNKKYPTSTDVEKPPESSVAVTISEYTWGCLKSSKSSSLASFTMPEVGPMLKVPAPWPWAFRVYLISRSANDLAFTDIMLKM